MSSGLDDRARRAARSDGARFDAITRALAAPMSRRRAIGVLSASVAAGRLLQATPVYAAASCPPVNSPEKTTKCSIPSGDLERFICVTPDLQCCNTDRCAAACSEFWKVCRNGGSGSAACDDTELMCTSPLGPGEGKRTKFCSVMVTIPAGTCSDGRQQKSGWCCKPGEQCGTEFGGCKCTGEDCGDFCCVKGKYCEHHSIGANECKQLCPDGGHRCGYDCCTSNRQCSGGLFPSCECRSPLVDCGTGCCDPSKTVKDPNFFDNTFQGWFDTASRSSSSHGGGNRRSVRAAAPVTSVAQALLVMAATDAQRAAAFAAFTDGHHDNAYRSSVAVAKVSLPSLQAMPELDANAVKALNTLLIAEAKASAQIAAAATALARSRAAITKHDRGRARRQLLASARFADQARTALSSVTKLRARAVTALNGGGKEVSVTTDQVAAFQAAVRSGGVPADLRALLAALGVKGHDLTRVRSGILQNVIGPEQLAGPVLIAPLSEARRASQLKHAISELQRFATTARKHPVARGR